MDAVGSLWLMLTAASALSFLQGLGYGLNFVQDPK